MDETECVRVYLRVGQKANGGHKVDARATRANHAPFFDADSALPTVAFAVDLLIPSELFDRAEKVLAEIELHPDMATIAAEVRDLQDET